MLHQQGIRFHEYAKLFGILLATAGARNLNRDQHQLLISMMVNIERLLEYNMEVGRKYFDA